MNDADTPRCPLCGRRTSKLAEQPTTRAPDDGSDRTFVASIVRVACFRYKCDHCRSVWHDHLDGTPLTRRPPTT